MSNAPSDAFTHQVIAANAWAVPKPFSSFAVRSEEPRHAMDARAPYDRVHLIRTGFLDARALHGLCAQGRARMQVGTCFDIDYAPVTLQELAAAANGVTDLVGSIAAALQTTGVLGTDSTAYRHSVAARIDYLAARGAGFHNDVGGHWTACLFWNLTLAAADLEFVMPHAGVRVALQPGDLIVFDQTVAHGLCRPHDGAQAQPASFAQGDSDVQIFLSGELALTDAQWAAVGSPWLPVQAHAGALDLMAAEFDERTGAVKRLRSLAHCMLPSTCYADEAALPPPQT